MTASKAELEGTIQCLSTEAPEIISTALSGLGYSNLNINTQFRQATGRSKASEQYGADRWDFEFRVLVRWHPITRLPGRMLINLEVEEQTFSHQQDNCLKRCHQLWDEFKRNSQLNREGNEKNSDNSRWANLTELKEAGYLEEMTSKKFIVGKMNDQIISIPENLTHEHVLVCGPTGAGKTRTVFVPNLTQRLLTSALVTEAASGDNPAPLYTMTAGWRASAGHTIHYFNPNDLTSTRINPLDAVQNFDDALQTTSLIIRNTSLPNKIGGDQIWEQSEIYLLNSLVLHAVGLRKGKFAKEGEKANLAYIRSLLREGPEEIGRVIENTKVDLARKEYRSFYKNTSSNFRYGVCSGLLVRLNPWVNPKIAALTEVTDFDPAVLKDQLFTFYFVTSTKRPQFKPVSALAFNYIFDLLQSPGFTYPLTLFLDELTNYGYIPDLPDKLTHIRNQKIGAVLGIQHRIQLSKVYSEKDAHLLLTQPGTRIFFRPRDNDSALTISRSLGTANVKQRKVTSSGAIHEDERQKPLLDASEVERLPKEKIIVLTPNTNPIIAETIKLTEEEERKIKIPHSRRRIKIDDRLIVEKQVEHTVPAESIDTIEPAKRESPVNHSWQGKELKETAVEPEVNQLQSNSLWDENEMD
ncbi:MAG: type IV secretory system conjugative DNA transfer family protein [Candidatus Melainabacteria bacterium]|nr:type IV secretory system conjugative DNA transfer family protein [Candidatus Melainabacteria bacterium]